MARHPGRIASEGWHIAEPPRQPKAKKIMRHTPWVQSLSIECFQRPHSTGAPCPQRTPIPYWMARRVEKEAEKAKSSETKKNAFTAKASCLVSNEAPSNTYWWWCKRKVSYSCHRRRMERWDSETKTRCRPTANPVSRVPRYSQECCFKASRGSEAMA